MPEMAVDVYSGDREVGHDSPKSPKLIGGDGVLEKEVSHDNPQKPKPKPARAVDVKDDEVHQDPLEATIQEPSGDEDVGECELPHQGFPEAPAELSQNTSKTI